MNRVRIRSMVVVFATLQTVAVSGCYTLRPVTQQDLPLGMILSVNINDAGRNALSNRMGPNISDVQGRLVQHDTAGYLLAVSEVKSFRDGTQVWSGERVQIRNEYVNRADERKFSRGKTALLVGVAVGAVLAVALQGIIGGATEDLPKPPVDSAATNKIPLFIKR